MAEVASPPTNEESKKAQEEGANVVQELQRELVGAAQSVVDEAEAECEAMCEKEGQKRMRPTYQYQCFLVCFSSRARAFSNY